MLGSEGGYGRRKTPPGRMGLYFELPTLHSKYALIWSYLTFGTKWRCMVSVQESLRDQPGLLMLLMHLKALKSARSSASGVTA